MVSKRGQITLFIVIGVLILIIVGIFLYVRAPVDEEEVPRDVAPVKVFVEECLEDIGKEAVIENSIQGGYYYFDDIEYISSPSLIPVYYKHASRGTSSSSTGALT